MGNIDRKLREFIHPLLWAIFSLVLITCSWASPPERVPEIRLCALPGTLRVPLTGPVEGTDAAEISCARNEVESFQVAVTAVNGRLGVVDAEITPLADTAGNVLPAECVELFSAVRVPIRIPDPQAPLQPGLWDDPLVPFTNPYTGEPVRGPKWGADGFTGERFRGKEFDLWQGHNRALWVDVRVPKETQPGVYSGTLRVWAKNAETAEIPVRVEVWDFVLPDGPSHENHFGGFERLANYYGLDSDSEEFHRLEDRYIDMLTAHRINPPLPKRLLPVPEPNGAVHFDGAIDEGISAFVAKHHVTNIEVPRAPFGNKTEEVLAKTKAFYSAWMNYLERKGWAERSYLYMFDEPNTAESYERVRQIGDFVHKAEPRLRRLVVEQPYLQGPDWGSLDDAIDIWCPLWGFITEASIRRALDGGDHLWTYTALAYTTPKYHPEYETVKDDRPPFWQIDFPPLSYRISTWLNRRYGATGLLYWSTCYWGDGKKNPWDNPTLGDHWNGEGMLFYPGSDVGIEGPIGCIRLKNLRDGMEDYEYFVLLEKLGGSAIVDELVRESVPTWGAWDQNPNRLMERRKRLAEAILQRQK